MSACVHIRLKAGLKTKLPLFELYGELEVEEEEEIRRINEEQLGDTNKTAPEPFPWEDGASFCRPISSMWFDSLRYFIPQNTAIYDPATWCNAMID